jgi:hypothetical protein
MRERPISKILKKDGGSSEEGDKVVGSIYNFLNEGPIKPHIQPQQRSTSVQKRHEKNKNWDYGEAEVGS